jgi:hypothetical protein
MQKSNIKMENDRLKFKNELKIETTNHTNDTNINCSLELRVSRFELKKSFVKFVQFVVKDGLFWVEYRDDFAFLFVILLFKF